MSDIAEVLTNLRNDIDELKDFSEGAEVHNDALVAAMEVVERYIDEYE